MDKVFSLDLNTSYVSVPGVIFINHYTFVQDLNTSYVSVPALYPENMLHIKGNLNTSYVSVPGTCDGMRFLIDPKFKYILCFGSSCEAETDEEGNLVFKYILCFGSSEACFDKALATWLFKYILCFGSRLENTAFCNL